MTELRQLYCVFDNKGKRLTLPRLTPEAATSAFVEWWLNGKPSSPQDRDSMWLRLRNKLALCVGTLRQDPTPQQLSLARRIDGIRTYRY